MADSKLGTLAARVVVDRGSQPHYGAEDPIVGKIVVSYLPYSSIFKKNAATADYFGPLKLEATLRGKVKVKVKRSRDTVISSDYTTRLFMWHSDVFNGSFKAEVGKHYEFPFLVHFPTAIGDCPIPPSFSTYFSDYPDRVDAAVVYRLGAKITTPGIKVEKSTPDFNPEPEVRFQMPRPSRSILGVPGTALQQKAVVQNKKLLPEAKRPTGMRQNFKAAFSSNTYPKFSANITCTNIDSACHGIKPRFTLAISPIDGETTAPFFPNISLRTFEVKLVAHTTVDTSGRVMASSSCFDSHTAQRWLPSLTNPRLPIALSKTNDHSVDIELASFEEHPSSFAHPKISRKYFLEVKAGLSVGHTAVMFNKQFPIEMLPSPDHTLSDVAEPGPSRLMDDADLGGFATPLYTAGPSQIAVHGETYLPPPAYAPEPLDSATERTDLTLE